MNRVAVFTKTVLTLLRLAYRWVFPRWYDDAEYFEILHRGLTAFPGRVEEQDLQLLLKLAQAEYAEQHAAVCDNDAKLDRLLTLSLTLLGITVSSAKAFNFSDVVSVPTEIVLLGAAIYVMLYRLPTDGPGTVGARPAITAIDQDESLTGKKLVKLLIDSFEVSIAGQVAMSRAKSRVIRFATMLILAAAGYLVISACLVGDYSSPVALPEQLGPC